VSLLHRNHRATENVDPEADETDELSERVRRVIDAYEVSTALDPRNLCRKTAATQPPSTVVVPLPMDFLEEAGHHVAGLRRRT